MWPFKKRPPKHKVQFVSMKTGSMFEADVIKTEGGLVCFEAPFDKVFLNRANLTYIPNSDDEQTLVKNIVPLTWPVDEPCPLFEENI